MKNIHILPTDKPSRLFKNIHSELLSIRKYDDKPLNEATQNQHIYITSDEKIKEENKLLILTDGLLWGNKGDICIFVRRQPSNHGFDKAVVQSSNGTIFTAECDIEYAVDRGDVSKIILTTDEDLIKDGVQAIDDEFLEWFIKNPSCDFAHLGFKSIIGDSETKTTYKIIIPKEEFSKDEIDKFFVDMVCNPKEEPKPFKQMEQLTNLDWEKFKKSPFPSKKVPKQETLEEFAENYLNKFYSNYAFKDLLKPLLIDGAKWQAERMYSEEEVRKAIKLYSHVDNELSIGEILQQFKKK